jgi:hypothetical protein
VRRLTSLRNVMKSRVQSDKARQPRIMYSGYGYDYQQPYCYNCQNDSSSSDDYDYDNR